MLYVKHNTETDTLEWLHDGELLYGDLGYLPPNIYTVEGGSNPYGKQIDAYGFKWNEDRTEVLFDPVYIDIPIEQFKEERRALVAETRWNYEVAGVYVNGHLYSTDDRSQTKYLALIMACQMDPNYTVNFKTTGGAFVHLNAMDIMTITTIVRQYIQACFDHEEVLLQQVEDATTLVELDAVDYTAGWPSNTTYA